MPRIEFYVLSSSDLAGRLRAACQLAMKGWRAGLPVFLRCQDQPQAEHLDQRLWNFRNEAFIPHDLYGNDPHAPVVLGVDEPPGRDQGLLVNLRPDISPHVESFSRVIEIVSQEPQLLEACRNNFRLYRQRGYDPRRVEL